MFILASSFFKIKNFFGDFIELVFPEELLVIGGGDGLTIDLELVDYE